ncbi:Lipoprotein antigen OS=Tsukamurella paurometabola (strain ATCC 8368 / DSM / CCUG 35730 / CIP 100753 / JCM 10117 / KCTC 9821 / NBRC 16120 / NCIMB 702349/ NCTC 13040) OX=521096 GN=Tpau_1274 PE=4 SV=1 [Tsukamurella paurometabola]|uniref:Lipoprotein antigen n=1 Tax=Tsukamurella paurometabola (strain ATCC 8368 / DSM 20162 / CCUG 35730 / CIP 100753 / JCM 10117 / KCTC 9821 / NBRC 16120 / NCIMB 702349 / NCTC 13040) TaxID=521096 RepID=D5UWN3_TSUPD|nr:lipoprotein LpqH [Tsukamurella paurometabola]ADG77905.1 hypothetical protein Tpau_1274 [Tsukamurella paurometabola DSM 20162]SUP29286.1 Uncharacterised protein [Tsukamurella paurometabola]
MNRGICSAVLCGVAAASIGGCSTTVAGTATPAGSAAPADAGASEAPATSTPSREPAETTGTATLEIDGRFPEGGDRIPVVCDDLGGGSLMVMAKDLPIILTISLQTTPPPSLTMLTILDPDAGTLTNDESFAVTADGRTYRLEGELIGLGSDDPERTAKITVTC